MGQCCSTQHPRLKGVPIHFAGDLLYDISQTVFTKRDFTTYNVNMKKFDKFHLSHGQKALDCAKGNYLQFIILSIEYFIDSGEIEVIPLLLKNSRKLEVIDATKSAIFSKDFILRGYEMVYAASQDDINLIDLLITQNAVPVSFSCELPLRTAIIHRNINSVKHLVELGADVNHRHNGQSIIQIALDTGNNDMVYFLREKGAR